MGAKRTPQLAQVDTSFRRTETPQTTGRFPLYIAINEYTKRMEDELDMKPGDKIQVITDDEEYNDGWFYGRNLRTDEEGLYPKVFTQEISSPSLMRAKSAKRVASPLANGSTTNLSTFSNDGSMSELPTPQPLETAAPVNLASATKPVDRKISVKTTMSDIDKALEEFRGETLADLSHHTTEDITANTTATSELSNPQIRGSMSAHSLTNDTSFGVSSINGIETTELQPSNANSWTPEQVTAYFIASGFDVESSSRFQQHKISGAILMELELAHLKELDINSFGTRFEIFKEIEAIKEIVNTKKSSKRTSQLMPAAAVNQRSYLGHTRKTSQSLEELPAKASTPSNTEEQQSSSKYRPLSLALGQQNLAPDSTNQTKETGLDDNIFLSPRKAPKPPSYPSPVQPPRSPVAQNYTPSPSTSNFAQGYKHPPPTIYERATQHGSSFGSSEELNTPSFQFPKTTPPQPSSATPVKISDKKYTDDDFDEDYMVKSPENIVGNRGSVIYSGQQGHRKTKSGGSFVDLFNRISMLSPQAQNGEFSNSDQTPPTESQFQRPSSSVYEHSRTASPHHIKHPSQFSNTEVKKHRRNSSILSFLSNKPDDMARAVSPSKRTHSRSASRSHSRNMSVTNGSSMKPLALENKPPSPIKRQSMLASPAIQSPALSSSPDKKDKRRSVSAKEPAITTNATESDIFFDAKEEVLEDKKNKRSVSDAMKTKTLRSKNVPRKQKTSAFMEGIRTVSVQEAMKEADCSGWMSKKGSGAMGVWRNRFFTLHGTRLSYFANTTDTRERGLIDITAHRVLPAKDDDKFVALYAASTGKGRYCFKLLPPQPGSKKGLTFTQPRVHYFAVETKDEMRAWMAALIKATIDIDTSVPIISSCATPTVSLTKAQEMLLQAREETRLREEQRFLNEEDEDQMLWEQQQQHAEQETHDGITDGSTPNSSMQQNTTLGSGFQSPYLLASGILSPGPPTNNGRFSDQNQPDYFGLDPKYVGNKI